MPHEYLVPTSSFHPFWAVFGTRVCYFSFSPVSHMIPISILSIIYLSYFFVSLNFLLWNWIFFLKNHKLSLPSPRQFAKHLGCDIGALLGTIKCLLFKTELRLPILTRPLASGPREPGWGNQQHSFLSRPGKTHTWKYQENSYVLTAGCGLLGDPSGASLMESMIAQKL